MSAPARATSPAESASGRGLLLLSSQQSFIDDLPNLGDRALHAGLLALIGRHGDGILHHAPWKSFPHLTHRALEHTGMAPAEALEHWAKRVESYPGWRVAAERHLARVLDWPVMARLARLSGLASLVRMRTGEHWDAPLHARLRARRAESMLDLIRSAEAALYSPGGNFADHLPRYLPARSFEPFLAARLGLPLAIVNYSIALEDPVNRALARAVLPLARMHLVREPRSREVLVGLGIPPERIITSVDSAFANPCPRRDQPAAESTHIAIMVRGDRPVDLDAWAELVERVRSRHRVQVHYVAGDWRHDRPIRLALGRRCQLADDGQPLDLAGTLAKLSRMGLVITDRYHGAIFAIQTATPVIPIASTTHKTLGLFDLIEYPLPAMPPLTRQAVPECLRLIDQAIDARASLSACLSAFRARAEQRLERDYAELFRRLAPGSTRVEASRGCP